MPWSEAVKLRGSSRISYLEDRVAWNLDWEREINEVYGTDQEITLTPDLFKRIPRLHDDLPAGIYDAVMNDSTLQSITVKRDSLCRMQRNLSQKAACRFALHNFENRWRALDDEEREKWILEGLVRAVEEGDEYDRFPCPEITIGRMNYQSGQGFLDLLAKLVGTEAEKIPDDIRMVPNPVWDVMNSSAKGPLLPGQRVAQRNCDAMRTALLTAFVWHTLLAFYGEFDTHIVRLKLKDTTGNSDFVKEAWRRAQREASPAMAARMKEGRKKTKEEVKEYCSTAQRVCLACYKTSDMLGTKLFICQKCKEIDRYVFYCSKECQTKDWKHGRPPHKKICGSRSALADSCVGLLLGPPEHRSQWDFPEPGFIRSPYLLYQLKTLDENPDYDYLLVRSEPEFQTDRALIFPPEMAMVKVLLRNNLRVAVCRYAPREVHLMYQILLPWALRNGGVGEDGLKRQLKNEFGVDIQV